MNPHAALSTTGNPTRPSLMPPGRGCVLAGLLLVTMLAFAGCFPYTTEWEPLGSRYSLRVIRGMGPTGTFSGYSLYYKKGWHNVLVCDRPAGHYFENDPRKPLSWTVFNTNLMYIETFYVRVSPRKEDRFNFNIHEELRVYSPRTGIHVLVPNYQDYAEARIDGGKIVLIPFTAEELVQSRERRERGLDKLPRLEFAIRDIGEM